ncbi:hypothetical protein ARSEF4850_003089 [Beauveria asiatica]
MAFHDAPLAARQLQLNSAVAMAVAVAVAVVVAQRATFRYSPILPSCSQLGAAEEADPRRQTL